MSKDPKCDSDYANLASYSNGISFVPIKAPTISSIKVNLIHPQQKSGYQPLHAAYLAYPSTCTKVTRPCCN